MYGAPNLCHEWEGGGKKGACATKQPLMSPRRALLTRAEESHGCINPQDAMHHLQRACSRRRGHRGRDGTSLPLPCRTHKCWGWRGGGGMRGVGNSIAMATVTSFYPGSNWRKPRGRSRSLPANRTCPSRPTLLASASPPAPPSLPPSARSVFIGQQGVWRRDSWEHLGASLGGRSEGSGAAARPSAPG